MAKKTLVGCSMDEFKAALIGLLLGIAIVFADGLIAWVAASLIGGHVTSVKDIFSLCGSADGDRRSDGE